MPLEWVNKSVDAYEAVDLISSKSPDSTLLAHGSTIEGLGDSSDCLEVMFGNPLCHLFTDLHTVLT
jgi:hypothetical protein